jgi:hypothetical protein
VSKRHQSSRRRHYGRRLHEVHERQDRRPDRDRLESEGSTGSDEAQMGPLAFLDVRGSRTRFGFAD